MATERPDTEEGVCNLALSFLNESPIAQMSDDNPRAKRCRLWFGVARDEVLRSKHWNFATGWMTPSVDAVASAGPLEKRYVLPPECLAVRSVEGLVTDEWALEEATATVGGAQVQSLVLVCNIDAPNICFTKKVTAIRMWDPQAIVALAKKLAAYIAPSFGKSFDESEGMDASADKKVDKAATTDAREKAPTQISRDTSWIQARTGGRWRGWRK